MPVIPVSEQNFEQEVLLTDLPVLVEFGAEWCGPCKTMEPELKALAAELEGKAKVVKVDIDHSQMLAQQLRIQSVPTFIVFHQGQPVDGRAGAMGRKQLRAMLEPVLPRTAGAVTPEDMMKLLKAGSVTPVDTREPAVFARTHIQGAVNLPLDELESKLAELEALPMPVLYCRAGDQTKELAAKLSGQGLIVSFLEGGVLGWEGAGFSLERPD